MIDNDQATDVQVEETVHWQELPDDQGKTQISTGALFPVSIMTELKPATRPYWNYRTKKSGSYQGF